MKLDRSWIVVLLAVALAEPPAAGPPSSGSASQPASSGQVIRARDGDVVLVENGDRVKIVRRRQANVRAIFNPGQQWVVLLVDHLASTGDTPDGRVDATYTYSQIAGDWPLGERWEGSAVVDDYEVAGEGRYYGLGLTTSDGLIQLLPGPARSLFRDPAAVATMSYRGSGRSGGGGRSFDESERLQVADATRNAETRLNLPGGAPAITSSLTMAVDGVPAAGERPDPAARTQPVRVGSRIVQPQKIRDVPAVYPEDARRAGITGLVVLEIFIAADGTVRDAKVLRSIPMLDQAALDAVRQWRYEVTHLNGRAVPVIITDTVSFR